MLNIIVSKSIGEERKRSNGTCKQKVPNCGVNRHNLPINRHYNKNKDGTVDGNWKLPLKMWSKKKKNAKGRRHMEE